MPDGIAWPTRDGRPISFIGQLRLDSLSLDEPITNQGGLLAFFYDAEELPWGFDPKDAGGSRVLYFPDAQSLSRHPCPKELEDEGWFLECILEPSSHLSIPGWERAAAHSLGLSEEEGERYDEVLEIVSPEWPSLSHQFLGLPSEIQGAMELECQLVTNGLYCGDQTGYSDPRRELLEESADEWRLLLQVDSDENADMMWGDAGRLYYWIRQQDLQAMRFDSAWLILQCG